MKKYSFYQLIQRYIVEIPIIQRDYAQGRKTPNVTYIREKFVGDLVYSVITKNPMHLGFVYGKIEGKDKVKNYLLHKSSVESLLSTVKQYANQFDIKVETNVEGVEDVSMNILRFIPLDGQQRLTTLFLLFWYINLQKKIPDTTNWINNFKYNNRKSALSFFDELANPDNIVAIKRKDLGNFEKGLTEFSWYLKKWDYDSTVNGALVMLQQIKEEFAKYPDFDFESLDFEEIDLTFDFLDLENLRQSDELYIKMNERGKQLTDFEHFKAWLQEKTSIQYVSKEEQFFLASFWKKLDTIWLDFFWKNIDTDYTGLDDLYFNYIKTTVITYHLSTLEEQDIPDYLKKLLQDIRNSEVYQKAKVTYIPLSNFIVHNSTKGGEGGVFSLFSYEALTYLYNSFETLIEMNQNADLSNSILQVIKEPFSQSNICRSFLQKGSFTLNYWDHTMYYAITAYLHKIGFVNQEHFIDYLRVVRNIVYNTYIQNPENMYDALHSIHNIISKIDVGVKISTQLKELSISFFDSSQIKEEIEKEEYINQSEWKHIIINLENHKYFYGNIGFVFKLIKEVDVEELCVERFKQYSDIIMGLFNINSCDYLFQRALLTKGDYLIQGTNYSFCISETNSLRNRKENWRRVFNDNTKLKLLKLLIEDLLIRKDIPLEEALNEVIAAQLYNESDWQYYFICEPKCIEECNAMEIRWFDNENIRLMRTSAITGYHLELRTTYLYHTLKKLSFDCSPFEKVEYLWDKNTDGHPGISFINGTIGSLKYRLDIRYRFDGTGYDLCLYNNADTIEMRQIDEKLFIILNDFGYNETYKHFYQFITKNDDIVVKLRDFLLKFKDYD